MPVELTLEQYKAIQEGAKTWLASTRTDYTCSAIGNHLISKALIVRRTSQAPLLMYPLFHKWLQRNGQKFLYEFNYSFIEAYLLDREVLKNSMYDDRLREMRTEFMEWLLAIPYSEINEINT